MSSRKKTPDILGSVLGQPASEPERTPDILPDPQRGRAPARRARKPSAVTPPKETPAAVEPPRPASASAGEKAAVRVVWEYREVMFYDYGGYVVRYVNGKEWPNWKRKAPAMAAYLNRLGQEGWELVSLITPKRYHVLAVFKRRASAP